VVEAGALRHPRHETGGHAHRCDTAVVECAEYVRNQVVLTWTGDQSFDYPIVVAEEGAAPSVSSETKVRLNTGRRSGAPGELSCV
jgi:hypothetical protein